MLVSPGDTLVRVQLAVQAVPLPELTALVARQACPNQEEAAARALWIAARERYATTTPAHGYAYWANETRESVEPERVGQVRGLREVLVSRSVGRGRQVWGGVGGGVFRRLALDEEVRRNGYAVRNGPDRQYLLNEDFFHWFYPTLGGQQAYHWVSDAFGGLHSLSVVDEGAHEVLIAFCPRDRKNPWIEGTLTVARDSTLVSAAWTFRTPRPDEEAGGDVVFMPWDGSAEVRPHLLPARSTYWRRLGGSTRFYQRATTFLCWVISPDATEPPLPTQPPDGSRCTVSRRSE